MTAKVYVDGVPMTESEKRAQSGISFEGVSRSDRAKIRRCLRASTTQKELSKIKGRDALVIRKSSVDDEHSGAYFPRSKGKCAHVVIEDPSDADTVVHEVVHHLRMTDGDRSGVAKGLDLGVKNPRRFRDRNNVEEAATVAETAARTPAPAKKPSGYYQDIPAVKSGKITRKQAYDQDREIMTEGNRKGIVGKKAVESVNRNFGKTNISKKKLGTIQANNSWKNIEKYQKKPKTK